MAARASGSPYWSDRVGTKRVGIVQSNYIPWKGYFDLIDSVDEFILYDEVQYTRRDWRNRNRVKTREGVRWLTVPVVVKGRYHQSIRETRISDPGWPRRHWETIRHNYARAPWFGSYEGLFADLYERCTFESLSDVNRFFIGLAASEDGGRSFGRISAGPILDRSDVDPYLTGSPCVLVERGQWRLWYVSGTPWGEGVGRPLTRYSTK